MKTQFITPKEYAEAALEIVNRTDAVGVMRPNHFKKVMRENRGAINVFSCYGPSDDGLERKNLVIV